MIYIVEIYYSGWKPRGGLGSWKGREKNRESGRDGALIGFSMWISGRLSEDTASKPGT